MFSWFLFNYQNNSNLIYLSMIKLNNLINFILIFFTMIILFILLNLFKNKNNSKNFYENQIMEFSWTIIPMFLIFLISFYSMKNLILNQEFLNYSFILKIISNQWFWFYEYLNLNLIFNSYLYFKNNFNFNLIENDNKIFIPFNMNILLIISSLDVIHSWTIPSLNFKLDSIPNQINSKNIILNKSTILFGQCSEICGINHSFMPINIESLSMFFFLKNIINYKI